MRLSRQHIVSVGTALTAALLSLSVAKGESASDNTSSRDWDEVFAQVPPDKTSISHQTDWLDDSALAYAKSARSHVAAVRWLSQQPLPAVDGINGKINGFGGGGSHTNGFYGTSGALLVPLAQQWGLELDGGVGSDKGIGAHGGAGHLFWRDPSIGLLGAYGSYSHWNGIDTRTFGHISASTGRFTAEGEYYWSRWTFSSLVGVETVSVNAAVVSGLPALSVPTRFFDIVSAEYYVTDNFKLSAGHLYTFGTHFLTLGSEYGVALGGGRMASLFTEGWIGEHGNNGVLAGLRVYFGQHDKSLIDRHRQDDPGFTIPEMLATSVLIAVAAGAGVVAVSNVLSSSTSSSTCVLLTVSC